MLLLWPALWQLQCPENHWHCTLKLWMKGLLCFSASTFMFMAKHKGRLRTKPVRFSCTLPLLCYIKNPKPTGNKQKPTSPRQTSTPSCGTPVSHTDDGKLSHPSSSTDTQRGGCPLPPAHTTAHTVFLPCR